MHRLAASRSLRRYQRYGIPGGSPDFPRNIHETVICAQAEPGRLRWTDLKAMGHTPKYGRGGALSHRTATDERVNHGKAVDVEITNCVDVIDCGAAGGGNIGSKLAHEGQAPFPEKLAEWFILTFCPLGGTVLDPMCGSGTTLAVAQKQGRQAIGYDIRESQVELSRRRLAEALEGVELFAESIAAAP